MERHPWPRNVFFLLSTTLQSQRRDWASRSQRKMSGMILLDPSTRSSWSCLQGYSVRYRKSQGPIGNNLHRPFLMPTNIHLRPYDRVQNGIRQTGDPNCYPISFSAMSSSYYSPGVCPQQWTEAQSVAGAGNDLATVAYCCPSCVIFL